MICFLKAASDASATRAAASCPQPCDQNVATTTRTQSNHQNPWGKMWRERARRLTHHATTDTGRGKLRGDNRRQRVVATDTDTHDEAPHDKNTDDRDGGTVASDGLSESGDDDCGLRRAPRVRAPLLTVKVAHYACAGQVGGVAKEGPPKSREKGAGIEKAESATY